jgi:hypothetical protein
MKISNNAHVSPSNQRRLDALAKLGREELIAKAMEAMRSLALLAQWTRGDSSYPMFADLVRDIEALHSEFIETLAVSGRSYAYEAAGHGPGPGDIPDVTVKLRTRSGSRMAGSLPITLQMTCVRMATEALLQR